MIKKCVSMLLTLVMILSVFTIIPFSVEAKNSDLVTVYFSPTVWYNNTNWNRYFIYYSSTEIVSSQASGWPGQEMEYVGPDANGNALFKYEIPRNCNHILFNNGVKKNLSIMAMTVQAETPDLLIPENTKSITYYLDNFSVTGLFTYVFTTKTVSTDYFEDYYFTTNNNPENTVPIGKVSKIAVSKTENNWDGDNYPAGTSLEWVSDNPEVLSIHSNHETMSTVNVEGLKYGTSMLHFIVDGEEKAAEEITVLMPIDEMLNQYGFQAQDNATVNTLRNAIKIPRNILNHYSLGDYVKVAFFTMLGEDLGFKTAAKEYQGVLYGGRTREEEALYKTSQKMFTEYFQLDGTASEYVSGFKSDWKTVKTVVDIAKKAEDSDGVKAVLNQYLPKMFSIPVEDVDDLFDKVSSAASGISEASDIAEIIMSALTLAQFDKDCVKNLLDSLPKSSYAYKGIKLIYDDMNKDPVQYVIETYCTKKIISEITSLYSNFIINNELNPDKSLVVAKYVGKIIAMAYEAKGGATIDDFYLCLYSQRLANDLFESLNKQKNSSTLQTVFELCVIATRITLEDGIKIAGNDSYFNSQKNLASEYIKKVNSLNYSIYIRDCQKEMFTAINNIQTRVVEVEGKVRSYIRQKVSNIAPVGSGEVTDYLSGDDTGIFIIPSVIDGNVVEGIDTEGFLGSEYETIMLPDSIVEIQDRAFKDSSATTIMIGNRIDSIGESAFENCENLADILLPIGLRTIGSRAFANCKAITTLTMSESVTDVGAKAFENCTALQNVYFENPDIHISADALDGCSDTLVVYGYSDSDAESIATAKGFEFVDLGKYLKSVAIETPANKTVFEYSSDVSLDGLTLRVKFYDGSEEVLNEGFSLTYDSAIVGKQTAELHCLNLTLPYQIEILNDENADPIILGDVDGDGVVSILDATAIQRHLASIPTYSYIEAAADTDEDGSVSILDATMIQRWLANLQSNNNIGKPIAVMPYVPDNPVDPTVPTEPTEPTNPTEPPTPTEVTNKAFFEPNGGTIGLESKTVVSGEKFGELPVPKYDYHSFDGWFTQSTGGELITSESVFTSTTDVTLYAHWTDNPTSDWVLESEVPDGARTVSEKWTYDYTDYKTSESKTMTGYTLYDTKENGWNSYGSWSSWSTTKVTKSDSRDVQTKTQYFYDRYRGTSGNLVATGPWEGTWSGIYCGTYQKKDWSDTQLSVWSTQTAGGKTFNLYGVKGDSWYNQKTRTMYRYRDRTKKYLYYFKKTEGRESETAVIASTNISNVQHWVRYIEK